MLLHHYLPFGLATVFALALAPSSRAQYEMRGQVEASQVSTCYYCPTVTAFVIHGSETPIHSATIALGNYLNQGVILTGTWGGPPTLAVFEVTAVRLTTSQFAINGNGSIGNTVRFTAAGANGDLAINLVALGAGVAPIGSSATLLLAPNQTVVLGFGAISSGFLRTDLPIPASPSLVGMHMFGQALIVPASAAFYFTEPDSKRIQ